MDTCYPRGMTSIWHFSFCVWTIPSYDYLTYKRKCLWVKIVFLLLCCNGSLSNRGHRTDRRITLPRFVWIQCFRHQCGIATTLLRIASTAFRRKSWSVHSLFLSLFFLFTFIWISVEGARTRALCFCSCFVRRDTHRAPERRASPKFWTISHQRTFHCSSKPEEHPDPKLFMCFCKKNTNVLISVLSGVHVPGNCRAPHFFVPVLKAHTCAHWPGPSVSCSISSNTLTLW